MNTNGHEWGGEWGSACRLALLGVDHEWGWEGSEPQMNTD